MKKDEYARISAELNLLWPSSKWEVGTIRAGENLLLDLDPEPVMAAVRALAAEGERFAPNPGQLRRRAIELVGPRIPSPDQALAEVYQQISAIGSYGTPTWSHPAIGAGVDALGGWRYLCASEEPMADRAHFLKVYGNIETRYTAESLMPPSVAELLSNQVNLSAGRVLELEPVPAAQVRRGSTWRDAE